MKILKNEQQRIWKLLLEEVINDKEDEVLICTDKLHNIIFKEYTNPFDDLFYKAMHFKSDSNPFTEDGECMVKDGYAHCEESIKEYLASLN